MAVFGTDYNTYSYPCPYYYPYPYYRGGPVLDVMSPAVASVAAAPAARLLQGIAAKVAPAADLSISSAKLIRPPIDIMPPWGNCQASNPYTWIKIYDVSNRANPFVVK